MTLAELSLHLQSLGISNFRIQLSANGYVVTVGQVSSNCSHTVSAADGDLESATGQALALWERVQPTANERP